MEIPMSTDKITERTLKIRKAAEHLGISLEGLSERLGLSSTTIRTAWLSKGQQPAAAQCLMLAGLTADIGDRDYWVRESGLTGDQLHYASRGLGNGGVAPPGVLVAGIADLVADPHDEQDRLLVKLLETVVEHRRRIKTGK